MVQHLMFNRHYRDGYQYLRVVGCALLPGLYYCSRESRKVKVARSLTRQTGEEVRWIPDRLYRSTRAILLPVSE